jgi:hypothetical protein
MKTNRKLHLVITSKGIHGACTNKKKWQELVKKLTGVEIPYHQVQRAPTFWTWEIEHDRYEFVGIQTIDANCLNAIPD